MFVDDLLDLFVEVLPTFDQGLRPALSNTVEIFFLEADRSRISASWLSEERICCRAQQSVTRGWRGWRGLAGKPYVLLNTHS